MKKILTIGLVALTVMASCKKKGCTNELAKNYDTEAKKDDGTCELYTNTEFLTDYIWKYSSVSTTGTNQADMVTFFTGSTFDFKTDGTVTMTFPNEPTANETQTWEFGLSETQIILQKGTANEAIMAVTKLDIDNLTFIFTDNGEEITVKVVH